MFFKRTFLALAAVSSLGTAEQFSNKDVDSTTFAMKALADNLIRTYPTTDGLLPPPYWAWVSGSMWNSLIHYWHYSSDASYNNAIVAGIVGQAGPTGDFMGPHTPGNDDQLWWGLACMSAAEYQLPGADWLSMSTKVFEQVSGRWQADTGCGGGIGWQIDPNNPNGGYGYMNAITNGLAFQLAARLARFTGDGRHADWANKIFDWSMGKGLINDHHQVFDGTRTDNCGAQDLDHTRWSYNVAAYLYGSAIMLDHTGDQGKWRAHVDGFIGAAEADFTKNGVLFEQQCEGDESCNTDQTTFKAYLARWLGTTAALIPDTRERIETMLRTSSTAALESASGGQGAMGMRWTDGWFDGKVGAGQQMGGLEIVQSLRAVDRPWPVKGAKKRSVARRWAA